MLQRIPRAAGRHCHEAGEPAVVVDDHRLPVIVSTHPRTKKRLEELGPVDSGPHIRFLRPLGVLDYVKLQMHARCVISDSGTIKRTLQTLCTLEIDEC